MREVFLSNPDVTGFVGWLSDNVASMPVRLDMSHSPFVPGGIAVDTTFAGIVPRHYRWRLAGMSTGDWYETMLRIRSLAEPLRDAVLKDDAAAARLACDAIAQWGADRNSRVGAMAFLNAQKDDLPSYLRRARGALRLAAPATEDNFSVLPRMNSTLCKIHSLLSPDGLPIYESRVAVAAATLVEMWRRDTGRERLSLPDALFFPAVGAQLHRRVRHVFADAADPGVLGYVASSESVTAARWADAAVRLGLVIEATLQRCDPQLFVASPSSRAARSVLGRKAAFIGALFIAGYEPRSLCQRDVLEVQEQLSTQDA